MVSHQPVVELDARFSSEGASPTPWADAVDQLEEAEMYWLSTVRRDGRPHVTPMLAVWQDGALYFCTGPGEQKAENLRHDRRCAILTAGSNRLREGLDVVVEGEAVRVTDDSTLRRLASAYEAKYGPEWRFEVHDQAFRSDPGTAWVFEVAPTTAFGFARGEYSQTRWRRFSPRPA